MRAEGLELSTSVADFPTCELAECSNRGQHVHITRYFFVLPDSLAVEDGFTTLQYYDSPNSVVPATFANVTVHQVEFSTDDTMTISVRCAEVVLQRLGLGTGPVQDEHRESRSPQTYSVADVITPAISPQQPPVNWDGRVENLSAREDSFVRAVHAARSTVRAVKLTNEGRPPSLPTYERTSPVVLMATAEFEGSLTLADSEVLVNQLDALGWTIPGTMILEHSNYPVSRASSASVHDISAWARRIGTGMPAVLAREKFIESQRLLYGEGEYGQVKSLEVV